MQKASVTLIELPIEQICRGAFQPRQHFDDEQLHELAEAIKTTGGLLQPIIVRPKAEGLYEIVAGERRWRAASLAGLSHISCLVRIYSDEQALEAAIIENISRTNLNPLEEAKAYQRLMDEFGYLHEEIAAAVGKSRTKVSNLLRILKLDPTVKDLLEQGLLSEGHGKILAGLEKNLQKELAQKCVRSDWSVRRLETEIKQRESRLENQTTINPNIRYMQTTLAEHIGCPVNIVFDQANKGKLQIDFHSIEIFEGILKKMGLNINLL